VSMTPHIDNATDRAFEDDTQSLLFRMLPDWPDDAPTRIPDYSHVPRMPWVAYVTLPDDRSLLFGTPEPEAFGWIDAPQLADQAMRPQFEDWTTHAFTGPTPADAFASAQTHLRLVRRGLR